MIRGKKSQACECDVSSEFSIRKFSFFILMIGLILQQVVVTMSCPKCTDILPLEWLISDIWANKKLNIVAIALTGLFICEKKQKLKKRIFWPQNAGIRWSV